MKALVLRQYNQLEYTTVDTPTPAADEVLVRIKAVGICGSDVHGMDGSTGRRIPPLVMGHEAAGLIEAVGSDVAGFSAGDRVTFDSTIYCGDCRYCRRGQNNFCANRRVLGVACDEFRRDGAFAEYVAVPQRVLCRLPDEVSFSDGAMVEPLSIAVHAVEITPLHIGDTAVVIGAGVIGLLTLNVLRATGCGRIYVADIEDDKLEVAAAMGATETINSGKSDLAQAVRDWTGGYGADAVFDAVGLPATVQAALFCAGKGGHVTLIGNFSPTAELALQYVISRQITVKGSNASNGEYPSCIELIRTRKVDVARLVSAVAPLADGAEWMQKLHDRTPGLLKVILQP